MYNPFLKWAGGKQSYMNILINYIPTNINTYYEPFVGGGAVLFKLLELHDNDKVKINNFYISDINESLINLYNAIKYNVTNLIDMLDTIPHDNEYDYYNNRKLYNSTDNLLIKSALLLILNKTCFRGLYRTGPNGFNVPYGNYKNPKIYDKEHLLFISKLFNKYNITFVYCNFTNIKELLKENDFIYFDPPYYPITKTSFKTYNCNSFNHSEFNQLFELCLYCRDNNILFLQSNSYCDYNISLYNKDFMMDKFMAKRRINSKTPDEKVYELLIYNYNKSDAHL